MIVMVAHLDFFPHWQRKGFLRSHFVNQGDESLIKKAIQEIQPRFDMVRDAFQSSLTSCRYRTNCFASKEYQFFGSGRQHFLIPSFAEST